MASGPNSRGAELLALKLVLPHLAADPSQREDLLREARTSALLRHPNVVEVYEVGEVDERPFLAMELVRGWPVSALLKKLRASGERLTIEEGCWVVHQAALGLHFAHQVAAPDGKALGLVHRDVSPQNLMVSEDGDVKVVDFGLAKATNLQVTLTGGIKGKLPYMPPEQLRSQPLDRRVDVFALGAVLWELVCGQKLYPGQTEAEVFQQALFFPQPHPDEVARGLPRSLVDVLIQSVDRELSRRTPSALALAKGLEVFFSKDAARKLSARVRECFEPFPRDAGEALGLPPTPQPLPARKPAPRPPAKAAKEESDQTVSMGGPSDSADSTIADSTFDEPGETLEDDRPTAAVVQGDEEVSITALDKRARRRRLWAAVGAFGAAAALSVTAVLVGTKAFGPKPEKAPALPPSEPAELAAAKVAERRQKEKAPPRPAPKPKGTLSLASDVPAFVREKGVELGMTPLTVSLPAGRHWLSLESPDGKSSAQLEVTVVGGEATSREVKLSPRDR